MKTIYYYKLSRLKKKKEEDEEERERRRRKRKKKKKEKEEERRKKTKKEEVPHPYWTIPLAWPRGERIFPTPDLYVACAFLNAILVGENFGRT